MNAGDIEQIKLFVEPSSVALIGVSRYTGEGSFNVLENLASLGFSGKVYPVNPNVDEILGVRTYPSIKNVPHNVDLAVILTPRDTVCSLVKECVQSGIKAIIIGGQGFADADDERGGELQREIVGEVGRRGARILGPNTLGVANAFNHFSSSGVRLEMERSPVGLICQSGLFLMGIPTLRFRLVGKAVDLGNACDVGFTEVLEYFENDPDIRLIALYVESVRDGRRFKQVAHRVARKKPILALKAGRSALGAQVARSHTGSLMGKDEVYDAVFKQCGIIRVKDVEELEDLLMAFLYLPPITGRKVGIISNSGAAGIMATDACQEYGLELAQFSLQTKERIKGELPSWMKVRNPLDVWAASSYTGHNNTEVFKMVLENLMRDQNVDAVLITRSLTPGELDVSEAVLEIASTFRSKPIVCWIYGAYESRPGDVAAKLERSGKVVVFPTCERATRALAKLAQYLQFLQR